MNELRSNFKASIMKQEGLRLKLYTDTTNNFTIGVGRNLKDRGISEDEAMYMLDNDIQIVLDGASQFSFFENLDDVRKLVVLSMMFNMGLPRFKGFVKMIDALNHADFSAAADEMLSSRWAREVGTRAVNLANAMRDGKLG